MQLLIDGEWHRRMLHEALYNHAAETPCGLLGEPRMSPTRPESYEGKLCSRGCFLPSELARAAEISARRAAEAAKLERERDEQWLADENRRRSSQGMKPLLETPSQRMKRLQGLSDEEFQKAIAEEATGKDEA